MIYMKMKFAHAVSFYKQYGLLAFLKRLLEPEQFGFKIFTGSLSFLKIDLNNMETDCNEPCSFFIVTVDDIQKEPDYNYGWFYREKIISRINKGDRLFVLKENEKMVSFIWVEMKSVHLERYDLYFNIPKDMAYLSGVYTLPEYRNRGFAYKLKKGLMQYLKKEGFNHLLETVVPSNTTALNIDKKLGFKEYQRFHYKRYWFWKQYIVNKYDPYQQKKFVTVLKSPDIIWKAFLL